MQHSQLHVPETDKIFPITVYFVHTTMEVQNGQAIFVHLIKPASYTYTLHKTQSLIHYTHRTKLITISYYYQYRNILFIIANKDDDNDQDQNYISIYTAQWNQMHTRTV